MTWQRWWVWPLLATVLLGVVGVPAAQAGPEPDDPLLVELTALQPVNPAPAGPLTVSGSIINNSDRAARNVTALIRLSPQPLISRSEVAAVVDQTTQRRGVTIAETSTEVIAELAPGAAVPFTINTTVDVLPWSSNGVYALFVEARSDDFASVDATIPVPYFPRPEDVQPSQIVVMSPVLAPVDLTATNALLTDALPKAVSAGGQLHAQVEAGAAAATAGIPITWLIDPAVTEAVADLASGTATFATDTIDPSTAQRNLTAWLEKLQTSAAAPPSGVYTVPYAEVDVSALLANNLDSLASAAVAAAPAVASATLPAIEGVIGTPPRGAASQGALAFYAQSKATAVVLAEDFLPTAEPLTYTPSGLTRLNVAGSSLTAVIPDPLLTRDLQRPLGTPAERFRAQAGLLADSAMITLELPIQPRTVVLQPPANLALPADWFADTLASLSAAPWITPVPLTTLLNSDSELAERSNPQFTSDRPQLTSEYLAPIPGLEQRLDAFSQVVVDPEVFEAGFRAAILRSTSGQWVQRTQVGSQLLAAIGAELTAEENKVTTVSSGNITLSGTTGNLPLTISNELDQAVEVGVILVAEPSVRLNYTPPQLVRVDAGRRVSVEIPVEMFGTGPLPVQVTLTDRQGRPFITTADLVLRSTATSTIAGIVIGAGALALILLVIWRFRRKGLGEPSE